MFKELLSKTSEASTWKGLAVVLASFLTAIFPEQTALIAQSCAVVYGAVDVLRQETKNL